MAEIADALGSSAAMARRYLAGTPPTGTVQRDGARATRGWSFAAMPATVRETLVHRAAEFEYDGPEQLLADVASPLEVIVEIGEESGL